MLGTSKLSDEDLFRNTQCGISSPFFKQNYETFLLNKDWFEIDIRNMQPRSQGFFPLILLISAKNAEKCPGNEVG